MEGIQRNYDADVTVDKDQLDIEWEKHPAIYRYWSLREVEAREVRDKAVRRLAVIRAKMSASIRTDPEAYGIMKVTVDAIASAVEISPEVEEAEQEVIRTNSTWGILKGAVEAIGGQRKSALHDLTELWKAGYFSVGGVPREMKGELENKKRAEMNEHMSATIRRRTANK